MKRKLRILAMLAGLTSVGCGTLKSVPPSLTEASLVPGTEDCRYVARGDNTVWWAKGYGWDLMKTDSRSREVLAQIRIPQGYAAFDLAAGFGAVWVAEGGANPSIHRIDAQMNRPTAKTALSPSWWRGNKGKRAYLAIGDHAVWATVDFLKTVFRLDPETGALVATIPVGRMRLSDSVGRLAVGEGAVWVLHDRTVSRIDPDTNRVTAMIPIPGLSAGIGKIAVSGGAVWIASGPTVTRIDPRANKIVATLNAVLDPATPANPYVVAHMVVANDTLWALAVRFAGFLMVPTAGNFALAEIDMKTNSIRTSLQLGAGDASDLFTGPALAVTDDMAWVCLPTGLYVIPIASSH